MRKSAVNKIIQKDDLILFRYQRTNAFFIKKYNSHFSLFLNHLTSWNNSRYVTLTYDTCIKSI